MNSRTITEKCCGNLCFGDSALISGSLEFGEPVDHRGDIGGVFRCGAADRFVHPILNSQRG